MCFHALMIQVSCLPEPGLQDATHPTVQGPSESKEGHILPKNHFWPRTCSKLWSSRGLQMLLKGQEGGAHLPLEWHCFFAGGPVIVLAYIEIHWYISMILLGYLGNSSPWHKWEGCKMERGLYTSYTFDWKTESLSNYKIHCLQSERVLSKNNFVTLIFCLAQTYSDISNLLKKYGGF